MKNFLLNLVGLSTVASVTSVFTKTIKDLEAMAARNEKRRTENNAAIDALHAENAACFNEAFSADVLARKLRNLMS